MFDGGDRCLPQVATNHCTNCTCHFLETCAAGYHPAVGDGYCNDETNIQQCNFDGGDCCGVCVNSDLCTNCFCLGDLVSMRPNALIGDGVCHYNLNNFDCSYDGGDCIGSNDSGTVLAKRNITGTVL